MQKVLFVTLAMVFACAAASAAPTGLYQTIDDKTGQPKSIVALYELSLIHI